MVAKKREQHGEGKTRLYMAWQNMKRRCTNENDIHFSRYGGRGIRVCDEWMDSYIAFRDWSFSHGYEDNLEIDRIDNDGGYEPSNCRWVTRSQQLSNRRKFSGACTSIYKGVNWNRGRGMWAAHISVNGKTLYIGSFSSEIDAAKAYDTAALKHFGEFANPNFKERAK